jgi:general secretion pathway protein D
VPHRRRLLPALLLLAGTVAPARAGEPAKPGECPKPCPAPERLVTATYPVADLITPPGSLPTAAAPAGAPPKVGWTVAPEAAARCGTAPAAKATEEQLMKRITASVSPASWAGAGGAGTIDYFPLTMSLVVNQTPAVHEQVAGLLATLRRLQDLEVVVEVRFLSVPDDVLARLRPGEGKGGPGSEAEALDSTQARQFLEGVQADARSNVMQAPKVTAFNGQAVTFDATERRTFVTGTDLVWENGRPVHVPRTVVEPVGVDLSLRPVVAEDRRSVHVELTTTVSEVETRPSQPARLNMLKYDTALALPDGRTALLDMGRRVREEAPAPVPVLSDLPGVGAWLRKSGTRPESDHVLLMVTPRIVVPEEPELRCIGYQPPDRPEPRAVAGPKPELAELLQRYEAACAAGRTDEAAAVAVRALAVDPACFSARAKQGR